MASRGFTRQRIALKARATGLPNPANARITGNGRFDDAAFALAADWTAVGSGHGAKLSLDWKSLAARADITLPQKGAAGRSCHGGRQEPERSRRVSPTWR